MMAQVDKRPPLKIGLAIESVMQPRWIRKSIEHILATRVCKLEVVLKLRAREIRNQSFLLRLYNRVDQHFYFRSPAAAELVDISDLISVLPSFDAETENLKSLELDVLINFGSRDWNSNLSSVTKYGVWYYVFGRDGNVLPGMREIFHFDHLTLSSVRTMNGSSAEIGIIYQCVSPTLSKFSVQLNNNESFWKAAAFLARGLVDLYHDHHRQIDFNLKAVNGSPSQLTNGTMLQLFAKLSARAAGRVVEKVSQFEQWVLAYRIGQGPFKYLIPPIDHFWADPFPIQFEGRYYIFFEDFVNDIGKACISVIEVDEEGIINGPTEVLKLDCHLSYPFVFEWQGEYYMIPETGDKNVVELYRSSSFPYCWELVKTLLEAKCPLDATLVEVSDTWWMFVNIQEENVAINWDELHIYYAESPLGPWKPHALNPVMSDVRSARPAGRLFWSNHVLYRPSQDSSQGYGYAMTMNRITRLTPTEYSEVPVGKILPNWDRKIRGVHTLNVVGDITVIDCLTKRNRLTRRDLHPPDLGIMKTLLRGSATA